MSLLTRGCGAAVVAGAVSVAVGQPVSLVASEFFAPTGSQGNGLADFETQSSIGMLFYAAEGGRLDSVEIVLSDVSGFVPEEARTDVEVRFFAWDSSVPGGAFGDQLALIDLPHEEIPDHPTQFTNWSFDLIDFAGRGFEIPIEAGGNYVVLFSLTEPFTTPMFGSPTILGLSRDREGPIYPAGEAVRRFSDGSAGVFSGASGVSPDSPEGSLDFFHRVHVSRSSLATDADGSGGLDFFDALDFLGRFDAGDAEADYDLSGLLGASDVRVFVAQLGVESGE